MPPTKSKTAVHPVPLLFFLSVVTLIVDYKIHDAWGAVLFLVAAAIFAAAVGWIIGRRWKLYPWQIGLLGAIPAIIYVIWLFYTQETVEDAVRNVSLFIFHPLLVAITGHFGGLVGRWQALKSRAGGNGKP
jgi:drug/metabolite transporter (DMT)-like permease